MGCYSTKDSKNIDPPVNSQSSHNRRYSTHYGNSQPSLSEVPESLKVEEPESLKGFNVVYTDFIGEKTGKITDFYTLLHPPIGKGAFGEVRRALHKKTNMTRAVKIIYKSSTDKEDREKLINEVNILKQLDHPNIMKVYEFYQDKDHFYIVSEFYNGGELFDKIARMKFFSEKRAAITMKQVLSAISYCHQHKIVHRDLKPENILYESKAPDALIKIIDFGTSKLHESKTHMNQRFGTPYYIAPEVLKKRYNEKCDVWSCGVILYILLSGFPPFNGENDKQILRAVSSGYYSFEYPEWHGISKEAKALVSRMLQFDPERRCSAEEALNDTWFKRVLGEPTFDKPLAVSTLNNLKHFRAERKLQHAVWMFLVSYLVSNEERNQLLRTFQALDTNGDGQLSREELIRGYKTLTDSTDPVGDVDAIMKSVDNNNSGAIDYTEFVIATVNRQNMLRKEKLEAAFRLFDKDGNGFLTADELEDAFNPGKQKDVDEQIWHDLIMEFDQNGDGKISLQEFKDMMSKLV